MVLRGTVLLLGLLGLLLLDSLRGTLVRGRGLDGCDVEDWDSDVGLVCLRPAVVCVGLDPTYTANFHLTHRRGQVAMI